MIKDKKINQITDHFEKAAKDCIRQTYLDWIKNHYSKLWHLQSILDELKVYLPTNGKGHNLPEELWEKVNRKFLKIISWTESIKYTSDDLTLKSLSNTWQKGFNDVQFSLSEKIKIEIPPSLLQIQPGDRNGFKFRKKIYLVLKNLPLNIYGSKTNIRKIDLHNFLICYLEVPVTNVIFNLWQQFLTEISNQYGDIFKKISELKDKSLFVDDLENLQDPFVKNDYFEKIFTIAEILNQTDIILQSLHERENQLEHLVEEEWKQIVENIECYWQYAGTFVLPNKKYREEVLSYNKKNAEKNFGKFVNYWKEHFFGIKANWTKNLEIYILQLHVIEEFRRSSKNMIINSEVILNPAFEDILSSIEKEEKKYNSKFTSSVFKQKVIKTKNNFLDDFKNQKIPQLVDAIHQTRIPETLENYITNIDYANNKISATHNIVKFQKNGKLPPKSKTYSIALPELIKNEIIQPYRKHYNNYISEAKIRISSIIRSLTEINHLYELNWDSANTLVKKTNSNGEFEEALSIIKASFKRSGEIIEKLWQESKDSLVFSKDLLIKKSQELYTGYQSLTSTDQLIDYNSKLRREKNQIHLQNVIKKLYAFIIYIFSDSIKNLFYKIISILHLKRNNKNKTFATAEEILVNYSKHAKLKLSNIPTVYRRLFLVKPESDDRFYFERKNETEKIKELYKHWQKGKDILSILIGEIGAGKTSILNFAEKNIFEDHNVLRINFESNCFDEQELLSILKNSFQLKNVNSWENLENKITKNVNSQVVILDNLHHLFLKIPNGFDALERFFLFLQRTQHVVFWLMSCSYYSWIFLDKILNVSQHINSTIHLEQLSPKQLKSIILERHKISGYEITFEANDAEKKLKKYKKLQTEKKQQSFLEDKFFDGLSKISLGNFTTAFQYWLTSIKEFKDDNIYLNHLSTIETNLFQQLSHNDLLTLVPFIQHDGLNADESAAIIRKLNHQNMLTLNRLVSYGLLENKENYYSLNMLYYTAIKNTLVSKKYIHENKKIDNEYRPEETGNSVKIDLYLPVKTDTLFARKIAFQSTAISKYIDLSKDISVNFVNKIYDGVSILNLQIQANIFDPSTKDWFVSEVTELTLNELLKQKIIIQEDFYI